MRFLGGSRAVLALAVKVLAAVGLVVGALLITIEPFSARYHPSVGVHDEAGILQVAAVRDSLTQLEFREPVRLEVLTLSGIRANDNFNMAVLKWARAKRLADRAINADRSAHGNERRERYRRSSGTTSALAYDGMWKFGSSRVSYSPSSTIRLNPSSAGKAATTLSGSSSRIEPLAGLVVGYNSASSYTPSSSRSSSGSSGRRSSSFSGGFSGAGSSSRF